MTTSRSREIAAAIGEELKRLRKEAGLSQLDIVGRIRARGGEITQASVSHYEHAKRNMPIDVFVLWCQVAQCKSGCCPCTSTE